MNKFFGAILLVIVLLSSLYFVAGKNKTVFPQKSGKLLVAASFYPMYYFAKEIAGDKAEVFNVTPASAEPHDYEPTTQDLVKIQNSNLLILNGGNLEPWGEKVQESLKDKKTITVTAGEGLTTKNIEEEGETITDPHIWLDPSLAKQQIAKIVEGFTKADPKNTEYYKENENKFDKQLDELDSNYKLGLKSCQKKNVVTSHAAFGYLAAHYGLNQVAVSGVSPDAEPSAKQLAFLSDFVKKNNIKIIFFESLVSPKLSETLAKETGAKTMVLDPIEGITDDDIKAGHTYLTVMQSNLKNLQIALQCN